MSLITKTTILFFLNKYKKLENCATIYERICFPSMQYKKKIINNFNEFYCINMVYGK